jgi:DNA-damage-inducible protein J
MSKTATVRARIDVELKEQAEAVLAAYGYTMSKAITMMLRQVVIQGKIPFSLEGLMVPSALTLAVMERTDRGEGLTRFESPKALFEALDIADPTPNPGA